MRRITVDAVKPNEQQPEIDHHLQKENSQSGYLNIVHRGWRDSRGDGFFSCDMKTDPNQTMYLLVTYLGFFLSWKIPRSEEWIHVKTNSSRDKQFARMSGNTLQIKT
ncbi:DUF6805 domain-containing protein [Bacillus halotolerans]|uniref:DUF6805 domain-containing protein n=1 Tax=Bacillus halotolerans TaxID=260554 RepID=UPI00039EC684